MAYADIAVAVLAAGRGVRFGGDKLLAKIDGRPLGLRAAARLTGLGFGWYFAVCRTNNALAGQYADLAFDVIDNDCPEKGQAYSLHLAVKQAEASDARALLVMLGDMPFVSMEHISALVDAYAGNIVASSNGKVRMPPVIFPRSSWADLLATKGDGGGRELLLSADLVQASSEELRDIDRRSDLQI